MCLHRHIIVTVCLYVYVSVCVLVMSVISANMDKLIEMPFGLWPVDSWEPKKPFITRNHSLGGGLDPHIGNGILGV